MLYIAHEVGDTSTEWPMLIEQLNEIPAERPFVLELDSNEWRSGVKAFRCHLLENLPPICWTVIHLYFDCGSPDDHGDTLLYGFERVENRWFRSRIRGSCAEEHG